MDPLKNLLFSSYKRIAAVLFIVALLLAVPITVSLIGQQQDVRQRAAGRNYDNNVNIDITCNSCRGGYVCGYTSYNMIRGVAPQESFCSNSDATGGDVKCSICPGGPTPEPPTVTEIPVSTTTQASSVLPTALPIQTAKPTCFPFPSLCTINADGSQSCSPTPGTPAGGWCITPTPTCYPRPSCLDATPRCMIPEPITGWCPNPSTEPSVPPPTDTPVPILSPVPTDTLVPTETPVPTQTPIPTPTINPNNTYLALSLSMPGIGADTTLGQNPTPTRSQRQAEVSIFDNQNRTVASTTGILTYDPQSALYKGDIDLGGGFVTGVYSVKVRLDNTLVKVIPGIQTINSASVNNTAITLLVPGDIDGDNQIDLLDYNAMLNCINDNTCSQSAQADLNDDGKIDEVDLNILLSSFAVRQGD